MNIYNLTGVEPSPIDTRDWSAEEVLPKLVLPAKLDLRKDLQVVRDQGEQGTCSAQTAAAIKEYQEFNNIKLDEYMSPQFIYSKRADTSKAGMIPRDTMKILQDIGSCRERTYPYDLLNPDSSRIKNANAEAKNFRIANYAQVDTVEGLKTALFQSGPCYMAVPIYGYGDRMWKRDDTDPYSTYKGNHAMTVVGYDDYKQCFIIRNSWGTKWGDNGYCYFPYADWGSQWEVWTTIDEDSTQPHWWYDFRSFRTLKQVREFILKIVFAPLNTIEGFCKVFACALAFQYVMINWFHYVPMSMR